MDFTQTNFIYPSRPSGRGISLLRRLLSSARARLSPHAWESSPPFQYGELPGEPPDVLLYSPVSPRPSLTIQRTVDPRRQGAHLHAHAPWNGICRQCRSKISASRLAVIPRALLCPTCIEERLADLSSDAI